MDPLTHALAGSAIAEAGFRRRAGPRAVWFGAVVAAWPDVDIAVGPVKRLAHYAAARHAALGWLADAGEAFGRAVEHRGLTHAWVAWLVLSPLIGWLGWRRWGRGRAAASASGPPSSADRPDNGPDSSLWPVWIPLAFAAYASHILLDLTNAYGTMVWTPFSDRRATVNALPIIDLVLSGSLAAAWLAARWAHWREREPLDGCPATRCWRLFGRARRDGRRYGGPAARRMAAAGGLLLALLALYAFDGIRLRRGLARDARAQLAVAGVDAATVHTLPLMLTNRLWRVIAYDQANRRVGLAEYSSFAPRPLAWRWRPTLDADQQARVGGHRAVRRFLAFTHGIYSLDVRDGGRTWVLMDRRHGMLSAPDRSVFTLILRFDADGALKSAVRPPMEARLNLDVTDEARLTWRLLWTGRVDKGGT